MAKSENGFSKKKKKEPTAAEILARQPPFDLDAEMGVLGSILLLPEVCDDIPSLRADDFYDDANRKKNMCETGFRCLRQRCLKIMICMFENIEDIR